ncbi:MAG: TetR/AcrR family transcriptional regulator [Chromatiales bacterium]
MSIQEQIVDIAQEMVQKRGFHAFSYRDIAHQVGIKTASIHYYFPTKGDLGEAIVGRAREGFEEALRGIDAEAASATDKLRRFCGIFIRTYGEGDRLCPMCMLAMAQDTIPEEVRAGVQRFWEGAESWVERVVADGQTSREIAANLDPQAVARTFLAALEGAMVAARAFSDRGRLTDVIDYLMSGVAPGVNPAAAGSLN